MDTIQETGEVRSKPYMSRTVSEYCSRVTQQCAISSRGVLSSSQKQSYAMRESL